MTNQLMLDTFHPVEYDFGSDLVVVGTNPEMADYDNPRGEIFGLLPYVRAIDESGNTRMLCSKVTYHVRDSHAEDEAKKLANRLNAKLNERRMPNFAKWTVGRPVYGSDAYLDYGQADDLAWERDEL